jgi:hypothetical protein
LVPSNRRDLFVELSQTHRIRGLLIVGIRLLANQLDQFDRPAIALAVGGAAGSRSTTRSASRTSSLSEVFVDGRDFEPGMPHPLCCLLLALPDYQCPTMPKTTWMASHSWSSTLAPVAFDRCTAFPHPGPRKQCSLPGCIAASACSAAHWFLPVICITCSTLVSPIRRETRWSKQVCRWRLRHFAPPLLHLCATDFRDSGTKSKCSTLAN